MNHPLVTIGITAYNAEDSVPKAIASALAQSWNPIEIIVVDDCSSDRTIIVLNEIAKVTPEVTVLSNEKNSGVAVSRNLIIDKASGEFLAFFDDDDQSVPYRVEEQVRRIIEYEEKFSSGAPVICHASRKVIYPDGQECIEHTMGENEGEVAPHGAAVARRILLGEAVENGYGACPTCSQMARLSTYKNYDKFDSSFRRSEDTEFNIRLASYGAHFVGISEPLVIQKMTKTSDKNIDDEYVYMVKVMKKHASLMKGKLNFCIKWLGVKKHFLKGHKIQFLLSLIKLSLVYPLQTFIRLSVALPNISLNRRFRDFHNS